MLSGAFREFETDPIFDFGNSPFNRHPALFRDDQPMAASNNQQNSRWRQHRSQQSQLPAAHDDAEDEHVRRRDRRRHPKAEADDPPSGSALVPSSHHDEDRRRDRRLRGRRGGDGGPEEDDAMAAFPSMFGGGFGGIERHFNQMFTGMQRMMANMGDQMRQAEEAATSGENFDGHLYSHSSIYSRRYDGAGQSGEPHVYAAMSETLAGPGGVWETRRAVRDSRTREERAAYGRHLGARGHVVERRRNLGTGDQREDHSYAGVEEADVDAFDKEWHSRATALVGHHRHHDSSAARAVRGRDSGSSNRRAAAAIEDGGGRDKL